MQPRRFFLNSATRSFVASPTVGVPATDAAFFDEDVEAVELYFLEPTDSPFSSARYLDYSANTVKLAVGITAPAALQTSWSAVSTTITASITSTVTGGSGANAVRRLTFSGRQPVKGAISLTLPGTEIQGSVVADNRIFVSEFGAIFENRPVFLSDFDDRDGNWFMVNVGRGSFQIANTSGGGPVTIAGAMGDIFPGPVTTSPISEISVGGIRNAIIDAGIVNSAGRPLIEVSGSFQSGFDLEYVDLLGERAHENPTVTSTLAAAPALAANLSFNTNEVAALISAGTTTNLRMEVEVSDGTLRQTYATTASIADDIITSTSPVPVPAGDTVSSLNFDDGDGGTWTVTVDPNGVLTATKQ
jgi:hypothetical protein